MLHTFRGRLVLSHVLVVLLCLLLSWAAAGLLITRAQRLASLSRVQAVAVGLAQRFEAQPGLRLRVPELMERLQELTSLKGRALLVTQQGEVIADSATTYVGKKVPLPAREAGRALTPPNVRRHTFADGREYFLVYVELPLAQQERLKAAYLAIALEVREVDPPWRRMLVSLLLVGAAVMLVAVVVAFLLASSITRPVAEMTRAAAQIAQGNYEQSIRVRGDDEIAHLAQSFTHMAQKVAQAQRSQRDFLANISHDLRTPLTAIQGFAQAILEGAVTDEQGYKRAAQIIHDDADSMARLIQDLIELARLEGRQLELAPAPVPVAELLRAEVSKAELRAQQVGLTLVSSISENLPGIMADAGRLEQAFTNLLNNAIKYSKPGGLISVEALYLSSTAPRPQPLALSLGTSTTSGAWVIVSIINQSEPISPADLPHIFERFYRGDKSRKRTEGSGLGLAIVRETVLAHGGCIEVASNTERGTCFRVWLPVGEGR